MNRDKEIDMHYIQPLGYEVNFLTEDTVLVGDSAISAIKAEFDLIQLWQCMILPFGFQAREVLDRFMALSLRKLLCDNRSLLKMICPTFRMPPLNGQILNIPGEKGEIKLIEIHPTLEITPQSEWLPLKDWLDEKIAWIKKDASDIPDVYEDGFFKKIVSRLGDNDFERLFKPKTIRCDESEMKIWELIDKTEGRQQAYSILKSNDYYDLSIRGMIRHIADKQGAHLDKGNSTWIRMANSSSEDGHSAISVFSTQMMYAAAKQIKGLENYYFRYPNN